MAKDTLNLSKQELETFIETGSFMNVDSYVLRNELKQKEGKDKAKALGKLVVRNINKLSQNVFVQSMMRGFMLVIPLLVVGGIATLIQTIPVNLGKAFNQTVVIPDWLKKVCTEVFNFTYGIAGILSCIAISYEMAQQLNKDLTVRKQVYPIVVVIASVACYLIFTFGSAMYNVTGVNGSAANPDNWVIPKNDDGGSNTPNGIAFWHVSLEALGPNGMLPSLLIAFTVPFVYKWCFSRNFVIRLPKFAPFAVAITVMVLVPIFFSILLFIVPSFLILELTGQGLYQLMNSRFLNHLYDASNTLPFYVCYQIVCNLCYFCGVHNAIISNLFEPARQTNVVENARTMQEFINSGFADISKLSNNIYVAGTATNMIGGLGSICMVPYAILLFAKSKQLKAIAVVAAIASFFNLPEPILFGLPIILNPLLLIPMLMAPIIESIAIWGFIHWGPGMYAPFVDVAWCLPWIFVLPVSTGMQGISFLCMIITYLISFAVWSPFIVIYDRIILRREIKNGVSDLKSIENMSGLEILRIKFGNRERHKEYLIAKNLVKEEKIRMLKEERDMEFSNLSSERKAKALYNYELFKTPLPYHNVLIIDNEEGSEQAKKFAVSLISSLTDKDPEIFVKVIDAKKINKNRKIAKRAQLILALPGSENFYEEYELIAQNNKHIILPITNDELTKFISDGKSGVKEISKFMQQPINR